MSGINFSIYHSLKLGFIISFKRDLQSTNQIFERLLQFLVELAIQLQQRLPLSNTVLSDICSMLDPEEIMRGSNMSVANINAKIPEIVRDEDR